MRNSDSDSPIGLLNSDAFPRYFDSSRSQDIFQMDHSHHYVAQDQNQDQNSSISPTNYFGALALNVPVQPYPGPRSYKSRKLRPCDFCRARQVACKIDTSPPCSLCSSHSRDCTFVERPKKKRRANPEIGEVNGDANSAQDQNQQFEASASVSQISPGYAVQYNHEESYHALGGGQNGHNGHHEHNHNGINEDSSGQLQQIGINHDGSPVYNIDSWHQIIPTGPQIRALDAPLIRCSRIIGETGESNPYLLRNYRYDENDECTISKLTYRRIKSNSDHNLAPGEKSPPPVVFMLADDSLSQKGEPRVEDDVLAKAQSDVANMFSEQEALRLIGLFFRFVYPYFPIISKSELFSNGSIPPSTLQTLPLSLLSAIYATALPFMLFDDLLATTIVHAPSPLNQLFRVSWIAVDLSFQELCPDIFPEILARSFSYILILRHQTQELHTPRLATLQACLLLLERAPTNRFTTDTPWKTSLIGWSVSLAQILGLTRDCSEWTSIPAWEMTLRKRLWYGVFIMDKWGSLGAGMPSHIRGEDVDVLPLTEADLEPPSFDTTSNTIPGFLEPEADSIHFCLLSELTMILSDIMDSYYSLRAIQRTSKNLRLSLELAKPLRSRLKVWNDSLPPSLSLRHSERRDSRGMARLSGNPSLSLAYIVATITLFRALLRPLENLEEQEHGIVGRNAVRVGAKECAKEVVEFVENLGRGALDAFWHSWSRANFAIASSFLMQLLLTAENDTEANEINDLVARWRWAMRIGSGSTGNGLMSLGLLRLDGMMLENGNGNGNGTVRSTPSVG